MDDIKLDIKDSAEQVIRKNKIEESKSGIINIMFKGGAIMAKFLNSARHFA